MSDYKRGHRAECNLIIDQIDSYLEHKDEIEKVIAAFTPQNAHKQVNQIFYISSSYEDELYEIDKKLKELGYETRVGRNMYTNSLSIAVLRDPNVKGE